MSTLAAYGAAGAGIVRRDVRLYLSYRGRIFSQLLAVFFSISLFYYIAKLVHVGTFQTPVEYFGYVVVGVAILEVLGATLTGLPPMLRQELMAGTFERLVISPTGAVASTVAMLIFPTFVAMLTGTVAICYGVLVFGLPLRGDTAALAIPVAFLAATAFAPFALLIGGLVLAVKRARNGGRVRRHRPLARRRLLLPGRASSGLDPLAGAGPAVHTCVEPPPEPADRDAARRAGVVVRREADRVHSSSVSSQRLDARPRGAMGAAQGNHHRVLDG